MRQVGGARFRALVIALLAVFLGVFAWLVISPWIGRTERQAQVNQVGVISDLTGCAGAIGQDVVRGIELGLAAVNDAGGIRARAFEAIIEDSRCDPQAALEAAKKLIETDGIPIIFNGTMGADYAAWAEYAADKNVIIVNVVPGTPPVSVSAAAAFSIVSPPGAVGEALARWAHEQGSRKAVVLAGPDDYGMAFRAAVDAEFQRVGGQVVAAEDYESHQSQVQIDPQKIAASRPDVIISALPGGEARMLFAQTTVLGLQVPWYVAYPSAMVADGPIQADGRVFGVEVGYTTEVAQKFREAYAARYPGARATPWSAHSYDAIWIGARAKIRDGTTDAKRLARVYALVTPGYAGATGSVAFDRNGVRTNPSFDRLRLTTDGLVPAQ